MHAGWRSQWVASVGLAPWTLLCFQQVSLVGLLANAWAIPLVTLAITPLALAGLVWAPLWTLGAALVEAMMAALEVMARWPGASWSAAVAPLWCQAAALIGALLLVWPLPLRVRVWGALLMLPMLAPPLDRPAVGEFELLAADVGQGTAVLLRTQGHTLLYDAGGRYASDADAGSRVLTPLALAEGVGRLDLLLLSHRDGDHIGGASALLRQPGAWRILSSLEPLHPLRASVPHQPCMAGQVWVWDDVRFEILHPREREYERASQRLLPSNGLSCVLRVQGRRAAALLTGDIEREQEQRLVTDHADARQDLHADVLLVPHHGSRTSSSDAFLQAVAPRIAVAQLGWRNRYGHPAAEVEARYRDRAIAWLRTDHCGAWRWRSDDPPTALGRCERAQRRRYWHAPVWGDGPGSRAGSSGLELAKDPAFTPTIP
ncbi:MAG TPA: DNA internalization-related competence protein ComEC/Rec2 [Burkholderiaceae bacterium]|nr:DNA internalization-related competence protein ComEC/Rec2 [Burkholderiaceae bacterium]